MVRRKKQQKKKSNYKKLSLPGLNLNKQSRLNKEYVDYDYVGDLSEDEQKFLSKFTQEYYSGTFEPKKGEDGIAQKTIPVKSKFGHAKHDKETGEPLYRHEYEYDNYDPTTGEGNLIKNDTERLESYARNQLKKDDVFGQINSFSIFKNYDNANIEGANDDVINELLDEAAKKPNAVKRFKTSSSNKLGRPRKVHQEPKKLPE